MWRLVVKTSVTNNSPSQDSNHPDDLFQSRYVTPGFKSYSYQSLHFIEHTLFMLFFSPVGFMTSRGFYDVPRVLIMDARSFQALATILERLTHLASISCWYRSNARQHGCRLKLRYGEFQKYKVLTMSLVGGQ